MTTATEKTDLFRAMQAEVLPIINRKPTATSIFIVVAWDGKRWSIRRESGMQEFNKREYAEKHAASLPIAWTHRTIVEIKLPGEP